MDLARSRPGAGSPGRSRAVSVAIAVAVSLGAPAASARPPAPARRLTPSQLHGGAHRLPARRRRGGLRRLRVGSGSTGVHCKPGLSGRCTGYSSQTTPPATIRVLVPRPRRGRHPDRAVQTYVENVLPNEWIAGWDGDALKAGAVAVKSYAWYWVMHYGGYVVATEATSCFDVTDDADFQVYRGDSVQSRTTAAIQATWPSCCWQTARCSRRGTGRTSGAATKGAGPTRTGRAEPVGQPELRRGEHRQQVHRHPGRILPRHAAGDGASTGHAA